MSHEVMAQTARFLARRHCDTALLTWVPTGGSSEVTLELPLYREFTRICEREGRREGIALVPSVFLSNLAAAGNGASGGGPERLAMASKRQSLTARRRLTIL